MPQVNQLVDAVYVLTVKTYTDRIAHIQGELHRHGIAFQFIFDHDVPDLTDAQRARFVPDKLRPPHQSLVLKHIAAWRDGVAHGHRRILVFEDDVLLVPGFADGLATALQAADRLPPGYLVFLGGADAKLPDAFFHESAPLFPMPIPTTEGYVVDAHAMARRLAWLDTHLIDLPADHLQNRIDQEQGIGQYWSRMPLVEQGSVTGMFTTALDGNRLKHSHLYNRLRYRWNKFRRRRLREWLSHWRRS